MTKVLHIFYSQTDMSAIYPESKLLHSKDQQLSFSEYHVSLGDVSARDIISIAKKFDQINFVADGFTKESNESNEIHVLLNSLSQTHIVSNFTPDRPTRFTDSTLDLSCPTKPTVWVFGCSHSHGEGLSSQTQRYGNIIADSLGLASRHITRAGSSLCWSLRHLINSEFTPNDIVIWQLTTPGRISMYNNRHLSEVHLNQRKNFYLHEYYNDSQLFFHHFSLINYGVRYLRSRNVKFVLTSILGTGDTYYQYLKEYTAYPEYCYSPDFIVDYGNDRVHAGPLSHKLLAQDILDRVYYLNE